MTVPFLTCLCPTYRRPKCLANALACYLAQDYPAERRELLIIDDAGQYDSQTGPGWRLISTLPRFFSLPAKFNFAAAAADPRTEAFIVWEDDDVFLPWHLTAHARALAVVDFSRPGRMLSTCGQNRQGTYVEPFCSHGGWGFRRSLFERIGGYPLSRELAFDQQMGQALAEAGTVGDPCYLAAPSYVFRWGNPYYHGQAFGDFFYDECGRRGDPIWIGTLTPTMDDETERIFREHRA